MLWVPSGNRPLWLIAVKGLLEILRTVLSSSIFVCQLYIEYQTIITRDIYSQNNHASRMCTGLTTRRYVWYSKRYGITGKRSLNYLLIKTLRRLVINYHQDTTPCFQKHNLRMKYSHWMMHVLILYKIWYVPKTVPNVNTKKLKTRMFFYCMFIHFYIS